MDLYLLTVGGCRNEPKLRRARGSWEDSSMRREDRRRPARWRRRREITLPRGMLIVLLRRGTTIESVDGIDTESTIESMVATRGYPRDCRASARSLH